MIALVTVIAIVIEIGGDDVRLKAACVGCFCDDVVEKGDREL